MLRFFVSASIAASRSGTTMPTWSRFVSIMAGILPLGSLIHNTFDINYGNDGVVRTRFGQYNMRQQFCASEIRKHDMTATTALDITPVTAVVGSIIEGVDITQPLAPDVEERLHEALRERGVLFFRNHEL